MTGGGFFPARYFGARYFADRYFANGIETGAQVVTPARINATAHVFAPGIERMSVSPGRIDARTRVFAPEVSPWVPITVYVGGGAMPAARRKVFIEQDFLFAWQITRPVAAEYAFRSGIRGLVDAEFAMVFAIKGKLLDVDMVTAWSIEDLDDATKHQRNMAFLLAEMDEDLVEVFR